MATLPSVTVLSGIQPTGQLHLGNYFGAVRNWVRLQREEECAFCIVDYHALTAGPEAGTLARDTLSLATDLLACGIDPEAAILCVQSDVPEHLEMYWLLACVARFGELARMTQFKDRSAGGETVGLGVLNYPVLQAADILIYGATKVPVGEDQVQHLELAREILRRFNRRFGPVFAEIAPLLTPVPRILSLSDPARKMSKSAPEGAIWLGEAEESLGKKVRRAVTDSGDGGAGPGVGNLLGLLAEVDPALAKEMRAAREEGALRYGDLKAALAAALASHLAPIREAQGVWQGRPGEVEEILNAGAARARAIAQPRLAAARAAVGLPPHPRAGS